VAIAALLACAAGAVALAVSRPAPTELADLGIRRHYWQVAWDAYRAEPWLGTGAGTYELSWLERRPVPDSARDAHSLYLESLSELGPVGVALLGLTLAVPLAATLAARRTWLVPALGAAYMAYLTHAAFDWDWEVPAVTLAALFAGGGALVAARPSGGEPRLGGLLPAALVALELGAAALFLARLAAG
jgi:O-antigen ligase